VVKKKWQADRSGWLVAAIPFASADTNSGDIFAEERSFASMTDNSKQHAAGSTKRAELNGGDTGPGGTEPEKTEADGNSPPDFETEWLLVFRAFEAGHRSKQQFKRDVEAAIEASFAMMCYLWADPDDAQNVVSFEGEPGADSGKEYKEAMWLFVFMDHGDDLKPETFEVLGNLLWRARQKKVMQTDMRQFVWKLGADATRRIAADILAAGRR
jgi:hypothetical protein